MKRRVTIVDIAREAGVTKGAVSYALNGQRGVSEQTRERILAIAVELGWQPNSAARALSASRVGAVGLVVTRPAQTLGVEPFFMQLIAGIEAALSVHETALMFQVVSDVDAELAALKRWWGMRRVDGVLLTDMRVEDPRPAALHEMGMPAVAIGEPDSSVDIPYVSSDEGAPVREAVEYLVAQGHRRIARVAGRADLLHTQRRLEAFRHAVRSCELTDSVVATTDFTDEQGARATRRLLSAQARPTALLYDNDVMAVAGLGVAHEMGISVPAELSLVAWDDSVLCRLVHPPLTAISRDISGLGQAGAELLLELLEGGTAHSRQTPVPALVPRSSTARPTSA